MRTVVLTADQRSSRTGPDLVPATLAALGDDALLPFERTAGDELQGVLTDAARVLDALEILLRDDAWAIGLGLGEIDDPLPSHARAGRGAAYVHAREAVNRAKGAAGRIAVVGTPRYRAWQVETALVLWAGLLARRTRRGWEVADLVARGLSHDEIAKTLGITQSAVSQRAQAAALTEAGRARLLATQLLTEALEES